MTRVDRMEKPLIVRIRGLYWQCMWDCYPLKGYGARASDALVDFKRRNQL